MTPVDDPYIDPTVGDLRNLLGTKTPEDLQILEPQAVFANERKLAQTNIPRTNDEARSRGVTARQLAS